MSASTSDAALIDAYIADHGVNKMPGFGEGWHFLYCDEDRALPRHAKFFKKHRANGSIKQAQAISLRRRKGLVK
tara:strand:- start:1105 stop:1326 length:222 start_codon:yes stop_codon:yes gene_type:complete